MEAFLVFDAKEMPSPGCKLPKLRCSFESLERKAVCCAPTSSPSSPVFEDKNAPSHLTVFVFI